ncbi:MAG: tRNA (adenosine(37)-N6)-threonylcarbamoyltransferase complex dimerization subunit type 1 TsaB [Candidatus Kapaibacterium sp.]
MPDKEKHILAIETSGSACSVALGSESELTACYSVYSGSAHDKMLAELIRRILGDNGIKSVDLSAVACSAGPGSFTGLRIGAAIAKAICFEGDIKLVPVNTIDAPALHFTELAGAMNKKQIAVLIGSHKDFYYLGIYDNEAKPAGEIGIFPAEVIREKLNDETLITGPAAANFGGRETPITADMILKAGRILLNDNKYIDPDEFVPFYYQEFVPKQAKNKELNI